MDGWTGYFATLREVLNTCRHPRESGNDGQKRVAQSIPGLLGYCCRASISCLISPIALAGFRPFGQVRVQFMTVWPRSRDGKSVVEVRSESVGVDSGGRCIIKKTNLQT